MSVKNYFRFSGVPLLVHMLGWWGDHSHPKVNYVSDDPAAVARQLNEIKGWGFDGIVLDWYGDSAKFRRINRAAALLLNQCEKLGLWFAIQIDVGALPAKGTTGEFMALVAYVNDFFGQSGSYLTTAGPPIGKNLIFEFGMETLAEPIDWNSVLATYPQNAFIHRNVGGFATPGHGSFGWIDSGIPYLTDYYIRAKTPSLTKLCFGSIFKGFDNRKLNANGSLVVPDTAVWAGSAVKVIPENNGQTMLDTIELTNKFVEGGGKLAGVICNTYNDWEEGSAVEGGILTPLSATITGNQDLIQSVDFANGVAKVVPKDMFRVR